ncbi:MAG: response regulator [Chthoniobacterales bacterium]
MKTENHDHLLQELRLAQLEIKVLREQLLKSAEQAQKNREEMEEMTAQNAPMSPTEESVIVPMRPTKPVPTNGSATKSNAPRVLCVEDSEPNYRLIESILEDRPGTDLYWAESGQRALALAQEKSPQLILLDLDLPDMHGSKVLESLQSQPATAETPVIVISADATPSQIERMLSAGARNYLTKPFEIRRFLCIFDEVFACA